MDLELLFILGAALIVGTVGLQQWLATAGHYGRLHRGEDDPLPHRPSRRIQPQGLRARLQTLANNLHRGRLTRTGHAPRVLATFEGREVSVELTDEEETAVFSTRAEAALDGLELEVQAREGEERYEVTYQGDTDLHAALTAELLRQAGVKRGMGQLFRDLGVTRVQVKQDGVRAWRRASSRYLAAERVKRLLRALHLVARDAERVARRAPTLLPDPAADEADAAPRRVAPADWSERTCPYCRDSLTEGSRVSCEACHSVLHAECYAELGSKCTTYGCEGRRAFPVVGDAGPARIVIGAFACEECGLRTAGCTPEDCRGSTRERRLNRVRERGQRRRARERSRWRS